MAQKATLALLLAGLLGAALVRQAHSLNNGVGLTPAMGWNSWNYFRCNINDTLIREVADAMVTSGLRDAGYVYVNLDDCWQEKRDQDGRIVPFKDKFPHGLKALADYVHSKGLKFGLYSDTGNHTCEGYPGSWGHEPIDAQTYAEWGVDYLKYDYCDMDKTTVPARTSYTIMRDALNATGRPILFSLCSWGSGEPHKWGMEVGNSWRTGVDLFAVWDVAQRAKLKLPGFLQSVSTAIKGQETYAQFAGPGGFNDPDMLVVGLEGMYPYGIVQDCPEHVVGCKPGMYISRDRWGLVGGLTQTEQRTHFAFWCMLAAPLILGNDPRHMSRATLDILKATEIIALNQDPLGKQATKVWSDDTAEIWVKPLADGRHAAMLFNSGSEPRDITLLYSRDLPGPAAKWAREVEEAGGCRDKDAGCPGWAKAGECEKNPGFMLDRCPHSCPAGCFQPAEPPGPKATAVLRDAWQQEDLGAFTARWKAHLVESHAARVVTLTFMEPADAKARHAQIQAQQASGAQGLASKVLAAGTQKVAVGLQSASAGVQRLRDRKLVIGGNTKGDDRDALEEEIQILRQELSRANAALKTAQLAVSEAQEAGQAVQEGQAYADDRPIAAHGVLSSWDGQVLLGLTVTLAFALLVVLRRKGKVQKTGQYTL